MKITDIDPDWVLVLVEGLLDKKINDLSFDQKQMLKSKYLEYLKDGMNARNALDKSLQIVTYLDK